MVTLSVDNHFSTARGTAEIMQKIDPSGVHEAEYDPEKALRWIGQHKPDIVWLDIEMPGINGLEVAMKTKRISPKTNIVFLTGGYLSTRG